MKTNYSRFRRGNRKKKEAPRNGTAAAAAAGAQEESVYEELDELQIMNCNYFSLKLTLTYEVLSFKCVVIGTDLFHSLERLTVIFEQCTLCF